MTPISLLEIRDAVASGRQNAAHAIAEAHELATALDPQLHAFTCLAGKAELIAAIRPGPLTGIAVGVKDIFDTHDLPTAYGSPIHAGHRPRTDAAIVTMLRQAGASIIGKTVTTEFAFLTPGPTRNPVNLAHTPGGSSSGSAAAVAAGIVPAAIGTQTGGSVIRPASYCGIAGYKPSFRLVPTVGAKTFSWSLDTVGFFAASVRDAAALAAGATGRPLDALPDAGKLRFGLYRAGIDRLASQPMRDAVEKAAGILAAAGHAVHEINEPAEQAAGRDAHATIQNFEAGLALADEFLRHGAMLSPRLHGTLVEGRAIAVEAFDAARATARRARKVAHGLFDTVDVLIAPAAPGAAPEGLASTGDPVFNKLWTLLGLPCVSVPGLADSAGLPLGIQIIAPFGRDTLALAGAARLEALLSGR